MLLWLIRHGPLRLLLASFTSSLPIPRLMSFRRRARGGCHCLSATRLCGVTSFFTCASRLGSPVVTPDLAPQPCLMLDDMALGFVERQH